MSTTIPLILGSYRSINNGAGIASWLTSRFEAVANDQNGAQKDTLTKFKLTQASELVEELPNGFFSDSVMAAAISPGEEYKYTDPRVQQWSKVISSSPAIIVLTPQYNWGYPGPLKNLLDQLYHEWRGKKFVLITYGGHGGSKCAEQLVHVMAGGLHMDLVGQVQITLPRDYIRGTAKVGNESEGSSSFLAEYNDKVDAVLEELLLSLSKAE